MEMAIRRIMDWRRKHIRVLICLAAVMMPCPFCLRGAQSDSRVMVSVAAVDDLKVSDATQGVLLQPDGGPGSDMLTGAPDSTARLTYAHNSPGSKKITAQVKPEGLPSDGQDITLTVAVTGGAEKCIIAGGQAQAAQEVLTGIASGCVENATVTYRAGATAQATRPGDYAFTVTFTSLDDE